MHHLLFSCGRPALRRILSSLHTLPAVAKETPTRQKAGNRSIASLLSIWIAASSIPNDPAFDPCYPPTFQLLPGGRRRNLVGSNPHLRSFALCGVFSHNSSGPAGRNAMSIGILCGSLWIARTSATRKAGSQASVGAAGCSSSVCPSPNFFILYRKASRLMSSSLAALI